MIYVCHLSFSDPLQVANDLLSQCWTDFSQLYTKETGEGGGRTGQEGEPLENLTARLNVLVLLSHRLLVRLRDETHLRQPFLLALYRM